MGKQFAGPFANWSGKVGNVVGAQRQGRTILRIYQPIVSNPKTQGQLAARSKFSMVTKFCSKISGFLNVSFKNLDGYKTGNPFSAAVGYISKSQGISGSYPNLEWDYSKVPVSQGSLELPYSPACSADGTTLVLSWADNSGLGDNLSTDKVMICAYNEDKEESKYSVALADRNERNAQFTLPSAWSGDTVSVWMAMMRPGTDRCSDSVQLAELSL